MNIHQHARTTPRSRGLLVQRVQRGAESVRDVAEALGVSDRTVRKWRHRYQAEGVAGLQDRSCRPHHSPAPTAAELVAWIERLRRQRWTGAQIAQALQLSRATVARYLQRLGLARLRALEPPVPVQRYEWKRPGDLVHLDIKKLGRIGRIGHRITGDRRSRVRGIGWEYVHVAVDDATRVAYVEVLPDEQGVTVTAFLWRALAWFRQLGIRVRRILRQRAGVPLARLRPPLPDRPDPAPPDAALHAADQWQGRALHPDAAPRVGLHPRLSHLGPRERALPHWLHYYNVQRPHAGLHGRPPVSRLSSADNLVRLHS